MRHRRFWIFFIRAFLSFYQESWKCHFLVCMGMYREMEKPWFKNVVKKTIGWYRNNFFGSIRHQITLENGNLVFFSHFLIFWVSLTEKTGNFLTKNRFFGHFLLIFRRKLMIIGINRLFLVDWVLSNLVHLIFENSM